MKDKIKFIAEKLISIIGTVIGIFFALVIFLIFVIMTPVDYIKYKRSAFFADTKKKYKWLGGISYVVALYEAVKRSELPIRFVADEDNDYLGSFIYEETLILNDCDPTFDEKLNTAMVEVEDVYVNIEEYVAEEIKAVNIRLNEETCKRALVLVESEDELPGFIRERSNCDLVFVDGRDAIPMALKKYFNKA